MKVVFQSDTHCRHKHVPPKTGDIYIHCGDWSRYGDMFESLGFFNWAEKLKHKYKIVIPGNHDRWVEQNLLLAREAAEKRGLILITDGAVEIEGLKIYCSSYTPRFGNWAFMYPRGSSRWMLPPNLDILATHGPPYGHGDLVDKRSVGCLDLMYEVRGKKPKYHVFGHVHEGYGRSVSDEVNTKFINVAAWDHHTNTMRESVRIEL